MAKHFQYCVLKYRPSYLLDERVNIGLLFLFPDDAQIRFVFPPALSRLSSLYPDIDLTLIRQYLKHFEQRSNDLAQKNLFLSIENTVLVTSEFLIPDANALFFSEFKAGKYSNVEEIIKYYSDIYFTVYTDAHDIGQHDEKYLNHRFWSLLESDNTKRPLFQRNYTIKTNNLSTDFDFAWQNGSINLVKSLGFDLVKKESIQNKAVRWFGEITQLQLSEKLANNRIDFLISKPSNRELFNTYDNALRILDSIKADKSILEEENLDNYLEKALLEIKPLPVIA
jgi:hypothetical protein